MTAFNRRRTKILATVGPASDGALKMEELLRAGVDLFRLNFSHGTHEEHAARIKSAREAEKAAGRPLALLADLQGPKLRVGDLPGGQIEVRMSSELRLVAAQTTNEPDTVPVPHPELIASLELGDRLLIDDGKMMLLIAGIDGEARIARPVAPGRIMSRKGIAAPGRPIPIPALTEKDIADGLFALKQGVDYLALSFVQRAADITLARQHFGKDIPIIAKIEKPAALDELEAIVKEADGVMVARGDLGVELSPEQVPIAQRRIVRIARNHGKPVIIATHMLESMVESLAPTRAEANDVATAVYQGADAVMLSAESAVGRHPTAAVAIMDRIIRAIEADREANPSAQAAAWTSAPTTADACARAAAKLADDLDCPMVVFTRSGSSAQRVSATRPKQPIHALTPNLPTARRLSLIWGVSADLEPEEPKSFDDILDAVNRHEAASNIKRFVITAGWPYATDNSTDTIKVVERK
ncbi:MAG TPA: pyruvate kinase [Hyphomonadaceae bacterium]|jgi:pyruvate kinase|nr:pyruvate kinase [Hyphomonadaceae bacterium]